MKTEDDELRTIIHILSSEEPSPKEKQIKQLYFKKKFPALFRPEEPWMINCIDNLNIRLLQQNDVDYLAGPCCVLILDGQVDILDQTLSQMVQYGAYASHRQIKLTAKVQSWIVITPSVYVIEFIKRLDKEQIRNFVTYMSDLPFLNILEPDVLTKLATHTQQIEVDKGQYLFYEGDELTSFFILKEGEVKLQKLEQSPIQPLSPHSLFKGKVLQTQKDFNIIFQRGFIAFQETVQGHKRYPMSCITNVRSSILKIDASFFANLIDLERLTKTHDVDPNVNMAQKTQKTQVSKNTTGSSSVPTISSLPTPKKSKIQLQQEEFKKKFLRSIRKKTDSLPQLNKSPDPSISLLKPMKLDHKFRECNTDRLEQLNRVYKYFRKTSYLVNDVLEKEVSLPQIKPTFGPVPLRYKLLPRQKTPPRRGIKFLD